MSKITMTNIETSSQNTPTTVNDDSNSSVSSWDTSSNTDEPQTVEPHVGYKKVLVTGGAGFIGSSVADELLNRGDDVVIVDEVNDYYDTTFKEANLKLLLDKYGPKRVVVVRGDICDAV